MKIFAGSGSVDLVKGITKYIDDSHICGIAMARGRVNISQFPDGETHIKFVDNIRGRDVFLVATMSPPANERIMELLITIDAAKRASASRITVVAPFLAYSRQDRKDQARVPITAKLVANLLTKAGADRILTMDLHSPQIQGFFDIPVDHLQAFPVIVNYIKEMRKYDMPFIPIVDLQNIVSVAPDVGRAKVAIQYAKALNCNFAIVTKHRIDAETVEAECLIGDVKGKTAILIDDLSTTGNTLVSAAEILKKNGATSVIAGITHNILSEKGVKLIEDSICIDKLLVTNTVKGLMSSKMIEIDVAPIFAKAIVAVNENSSLSPLFEV
jgi:ribose-phosphate pyrophosphokinase